MSSYTLMSELERHMDLEQTTHLAASRIRELERYIAMEHTCDTLRDALRDAVASIKELSDKLGEAVEALAESEHETQEFMSELELKEQVLIRSHRERWAAVSRLESVEAELALLHEAMQTTTEDTDEQRIHRMSAEFLDTGLQTEARRDQIERRSKAAAWLNQTPDASEIARRSPTNKVNY